jgi:hypothetical protein
MDYLYGAYGSGNFGDDLICQGALLRYPNVSIIFAFFVKPVINGFNSSNIFLTENNFENVISKLEIDNNVKNRRFILAGGGLFWSAEHINEMLKISEYCKNNEIKFIIDRVGLQGMEGNIDDSISLLTNATKVIVRDESSKNIAYKFGLNKNIPIFIGPCFVEFLPPLKHNSNSITCFLSLYVFLNNDRDNTIELCKKIVSEFPSFTFKYLIQTDHFMQHCSEVPVVKNLIEHVPEIDILNYKTPMEYYSAYNDCSFIISSGYHASLIPILNSIPLFHIAYETQDDSKYMALRREHNLDGFLQPFFQPMDKDAIINNLKDFLDKKHISYWNF